jgi:hypothetical protein
LYRAFSWKATKITWKYRSTYFRMLFNLCWPWFSTRSPRSYSFRAREVSKENESFDHDRWTLCYLRNTCCWSMCQTWNSLPWRVRYISQLKVR